MMKIKSFIAISLIVLLSSCSNFLQVEKRQYRKGFHIENFFAFNKQKNVLLSVKDTTVKQQYYQKDSIITEEEGIREVVVVLADNDSLIAETMLETVYNLPLVDIPKTEKTKEEDPDDEEEEVKPNVFDIISSVLGLISVVSFFAFWFYGYFIELYTTFGITTFYISVCFVPTTILTFIIGKFIDLTQNKEKNKRWNKRAKVSFILTIIVALMLSGIFYVFYYLLI